MKQIKAIETRYKGYRFRSRLEARWAVFFDAMGLQWEYEPEGFDLGAAGWYLPDFYLTNLNMWVEIKGGAASNKELNKCRMLFDAFNGEAESTDLMATGDSRIVGDVCKFVISKVYETHGERDESLGIIKKEIQQICKENNSRAKVLCFEGLLNNGWLNIGSSGSVQCNPKDAIESAIGDWIYGIEGGFSAKNIARVDCVMKEIEKAFYKARAARFEHGEQG